MLKRLYRLRRRSDFARTHKKGRVYHNHLLSIKVLPNHLPQSRVGIVVSTKISKKAVVRNRVRRRVQGQLKEIWPIITPGHDLIIMPRAETLAAPTIEIKKALLGCLDKAKLLHLDEE